MSDAMKTTTAATAKGTAAKAKPAAKAAPKAAKAKKAPAPKPEPWKPSAEAIKIVASMDAMSKDDKKNIGFVVKESIRVRTEAKAIRERDEVVESK